MFDIKIENGCISELIYGENNFAEPGAKTGSVGFTLKSDDITAQPERTDCNLYFDRTSTYNDVKVEDGVTVCRDTENKICTKYYADDDGLHIFSHTENEEISQFALNFDLNFLGKKCGKGETQLLPTSPYMSDDKDYFYYLLTYDCGKCMVILSEEKCDGWKIGYSPYSCGHYILRLQIMGSFDKVFEGSGRKEIKLRVFMADSVDDAFEKISDIFDAPLCKNLLNGGFDGRAVVEINGNADEYKVVSPSGRAETFKISGKTAEIELKEFGLYKIIPYRCGKKGLNSSVWNGADAGEQFTKCTDAIRKPYHNDDNLCEGGCFLWSMLCNRRMTGNTKNDDVIKKELSIVMCEEGEPVRRKTIVPYKTEYAPYHICGSKRIQEQYFGVSILLEAYKAFDDRRYIDFAANALDELLENYFKDGMIYNGQDYTTVTAPVIAIADMANTMKSIDCERAEKYAAAAVKVADFLVKRDLLFPTEGIYDEGSREWEDGSISCTALSVLYVCANLKYDRRYIDFAKKLLDIHKAFTIYTPDARMNGSSFRWWETIWEGDGEGPSICAGHAWTIWRAEALYWYGVLTGDKQSMTDSANGFVTNFAKIDENGRMYACFEPDYIRGGGMEAVKRNLRQLSDGQHIDSFKIANSYPKHADNSLSRYAWVRYCYTWGND